MVCMSQTVRSVFFIILASLFLGACGGGGGKKSDTTPNGFSFVAQNDVALGESVESASVTISGIDAAAAISVTGGEYAIGTGAYTSAAGTITSGQAVKLRVTASGQFSAAVVASLTVGGVSGSFSATTLSLDDDPEVFAPAAPQTGIVISAPHEFTAFTVAGINDVVSISIENGLYAINGGSLTDAAGQVSVDDSVVVQVTAASTFATTISATLTVGSREGVFSVESEVEDTTPDSFDLGVDGTATSPEEWLESQVITLAGINSAANISIANGEFKLVGTDDYPSSATTVTNGQQVQVRVQASDLHATTETATLTIGAVSDTFAVITNDETAPEASVVFPTPNTLSDGTTLTLRGKASDDFGPVTRVQVVVTTDEGTVEVDNQTIAAGDGEDYRDTWAVQVGLATDKVNAISVVATDEAGNEQGVPVELVVTQSTTRINFPVGNDEAFGQFTAKGIAWDRGTDRLFVPGSSPNQRILVVNINDGIRSVFIDNDPAFQSFSMVQVLPEQNQLLFCDQLDGLIFKADLTSGVFSVLSDSSSPDSNASIMAPYGMQLHSNGDLYVVDAFLESLYLVNLETGSRTLVSDSTRPIAGVNPFDVPTSLVLDEPNNRTLVVDEFNAQLLWVDLSSGERTVWVDSDELSEPFDIAMDLDDNRVILVDRGVQSILAVDLSTGDLTTLSSPSVPDGGANNIEEPWSLALDAEENIAFVATGQSFFSPNVSIKLVDLTTGERVIVTNSVINFD
jgi:hypothetical protein